MIEKIKNGFIFILKLFIIITFLTTLASFLNSHFNINKTYVYGYKTAVVVSESMVPELQVGDMLLIKQVDYDSLQVGDIIAYEQEINEKTVVIVHRIYEIKDNYIRTKGDNNPDVDTWIATKHNLVGKVIYNFK